MDDKSILTDVESDALKEQIKTCSITLISVKQTSVKYNDGGEFSKGVEVTFGVASVMETNFAIIQTVPLPRSAFPIDKNLNLIVEAAKTALKQRLRKFDEQLLTPGVSWL